MVIVHSNGGLGVISTINVGNIMLKWILSTLVKDQWN